MKHKSLTLIVCEKASSSNRRSKTISANLADIRSFLRCETLKTLRESYYSMIAQHPGFSVKAYMELLRTNGVSIESNSIAGRFTELKDAKLIYSLPEPDEDGSQRWVVTPGITYHAGWALYAATANKAKKKNGLSKLDRHLKSLQTILRAQILSECKDNDLIQAITSCIAAGMLGGEQEFFKKMKLLKEELAPEMALQKKSLADAA